MGQLGHSYGQGNSQGGILTRGTVSALIDAGSKKVREKDNMKRKKKEPTSKVEGLTVTRKLMLKFKSLSCSEPFSHLEKTSTPRRNESAKHKDCGGDSRGAVVRMGTGERPFFSHLNC